MAESVLPLIHDPNTAAGREALNIPPLEGVEFVSFRLRPGDDASCLNLYQPRNPRILAPPAAFLRSARFAFQDAVARTANPWLLLESQPADGAIPAIADANSMTYVLHLKLGEEFVLDQTRFRIVAALQDSLFQGELLISEKNFLRLFPDVEGYRFFLLNVPPSERSEVTGVLEGALSDYGFDIQPTEARLAGFHKVENTYLSTFRSLGALGLVLGTVGLGAILLRNVLERRRELALLRAVGYRPAHLAAMVLAENVLLLLLGLATGTVCALLAIAPAVSLRGGHLPMRFAEPAAGRRAGDRDCRVARRHSRGSAISVAGGPEIGVIFTNHVFSQGSLPWGFFAVAGAQVGRSGEAPSEILNSGILIKNATTLALWGTK